MFQFIMVLILDGYLEGSGELDDPVVGRNGGCVCRGLQVVGDVADVTDACGPWTTVAVWL